MLASMTISVSDHSNRMLEYRSSCILLQFLVLFRYSYYCSLLRYCCSFILFIVISYDIVVPLFVLLFLLRCCFSLFVLVVHELNGFGSIGGFWKSISKPAESPWPPLLAFHSAVVAVSTSHVHSQIIYVYHRVLISILA